MIIVNVLFGMGTIIFSIRVHSTFNNYVDRILPFSDPPTSFMDSFYTLSVDKNRHFLTPFPPHVFHVVIECPLRSAFFCVDKDVKVADENFPSKLVPDVHRTMG